MANFFSADYWKALYFKAMGGQETAVDPNAMSGSFAGSASFTGTLDQPEGAIAGSFAGSSEFDGSLVGIGSSDGPEIDGHDGWPRRKATIVEDMAELRRRWAEEDANRQEAKRRQDAAKAARRRAIAKALGTEPEPEQRPVVEISQERLKALAALLDHPKPVLTIAKPSLIDFKARRERKAQIEADRKAREEARVLAEQIKQEIRNYDDAIILLLLAA